MQYLTVMAILAAIKSDVKNMVYREEKEKHCSFCKHFLLINSDVTKNPWDIYDKIKCEKQGFISQNKAEKCDDYEKVLFLEDRLEDR